MDFKFTEGHKFERIDSNLLEKIKDIDVSSIDIKKLDRPLFEKEENDKKYDIDDNGIKYMKENRLIPNTTYTLNNSTYQTDKNSRIISCEATPKYSEDGVRNIKEQCEAGGEFRKEKDDGGHIVAKVLGGCEGKENLVAMRSTINRGDYKSMENEIVSSVKEGKSVDLKVDLDYKKLSDRPSMIEAQYNIDSKKIEYYFDNEEKSVKLLDVAKDNLQKENYKELKGELKDMKNGGIDVSVTSVKIEYDENKIPKLVKVTILDETNNFKTKLNFDSLERGH